MLFKLIEALPLLTLVASSSTAGVKSLGRTERLIAITAARFLTASNDSSLPSLPNFELSQAPSDPVVAHWLRWSRAHDRKRVFCSLQADLEKQMVQLADGFPQLEIIADDHRPSAVVSSEKEIDALVASDSARATAKEKLQSRVNAWNDADALLGYSASLEAEAAVDQVRTELAEMTWKTPASSLVGVTAKLHCLLEMENPDCVLDEAPWPQLLSILNDLLNLAGQIAPGRSVDPERQHDSVTSIGSSCDPLSMLRPGSSSLSNEAAWFLR